MKKLAAWTLLILGMIILSPLILVGAILLAVALTLGSLYNFVVVTTNQGSPQDVCWSDFWDEVVRNKPRPPRPTGIL